MGNILVVDDSPINLRIIEKVLTGLKLKVTTAMSGREALDKITTMEYDMVFMDHLMPGMDGVEALHAIRNMNGEYYRKIPVVILTANEAGEAREWFLAEGFDEFLRKPLTPSALEPVLQRFLPTEDKPEERETTVTFRETKNVPENWEELLITAGLDVKTALLYCGGKEPYLEILQLYCKAEERTVQELEQAFGDRDWENYTIIVHRVKSAMQSIGALRLSEEARKLEMAGRTENIEYIPEHHGGFMEQYKKLFSEIKATQLFVTNETQVPKEESCGLLKEMQEDEFCRLLDEMEDAAYDWDGKRVKELITSLNGYRYKGAALAEAVEAVERKLQKSDYLAAVESIRQWK